MPFASTVDRFEHVSSAPTADGVRQQMLRRVTLAIGLAIVAIQFARLVHTQKGDFDVHWESGRRMLHGESLYAPTPEGDQRGHNYPYPPFWALVHLPFALLPVHLAQLLLFPLFLVAYTGLIFCLNHLTRPFWPTTVGREFWAVTLAVLLSSRFLIRDLPECGVNLFLVMLSWWSVACWRRQSDWQAGTLLGLAMSLKCTPGLFLLWLIAKRQWKTVGCTVVMAGAFTASPLLWMGPAAWSQSIQTWLGFVWQGVGNSDPSLGVLGDEPLQNMALKPALARYLMQLPAGHRSRVDHPGYLDFGNLSPETAALVTRLLILTFIATAAWLLRHPARDRGESRWLWEAAGISVLLLLLSPITWGQHCVGVLPACYLCVRACVSRGNWPRWMIAGLVTFGVCIVVLNRTVVGRTATYLLDSYHVGTACLLLLLSITWLGCRYFSPPACNSA